jgi:transposase
VFNRPDSRQGLYAFTANARIARQDNDMIDASAVIGIDVSSTSLDVALGLDGPVRTFSNDLKGHRELARVLKQHKPQRIVLEATGGYERPVLRHLVDRKFPAIRVNPRQVRDFARATGILAKTDAIDARVLARFGVAVEPVHRPLPDRNEERLATLQTRRCQLIGLRTAEKNRIQQTTDPLVKRTITAVMATIDEQIAKLEAESSELIREHQRMQRVFTILTSVPGVGPVTASVLIGQMPELGKLSRQEVAALAGLAPYNADSGSHRGERHIRGGRSGVRTALYMATLTGLRCNDVLARDFDRLTTAGKVHKVAMTACMRKLLTILNALVRDDVLWGEKSRKLTDAT